MQVVNIVGVDVWRIINEYAGDRHELENTSMRHLITVAVRLYSVSWGNRFVTPSHYDMLRFNRETRATIADEKLSFVRRYRHREPSPKAMREFKERQRRLYSRLA